MASCYSWAGTKDLVAHRPFYSRKKGLLALVGARTMYIIRAIHMIIRDYGFVGLFFMLGIVFVAGAFIVSWMLRPRDPNPAKASVYECGEIVKGSSRVQFNVSYYLVALVFVIFDIEILFLVPWTTVFRELGIVPYIEMMVFIAILAFGLIYAWKKGVFEWQ